MVRLLLVSSWMHGSCMHCFSPTNYRSRPATFAITTPYVSDPRAVSDAATLNLTNRVLQP
jgi:hypothetical protein